MSVKTACAVVIDVMIFESASVYVPADARPYLRAMTMAFGTCNVLAVRPISDHESGIRCEPILELPLRVLSSMCIAGS
jgi:hypothetical protein